MDSAVYFCCVFPAGNGVRAASKSLNRFILCSLAAKYSFSQPIRWFNDKSNKDFTDFLGDISSGYKLRSFVFLI